MISKEAQKSIKTYKRIASFFGFLYRTPNEMTKGRLGFARWFNNLAGTINPKVEGTVKEELYFGDFKKALEIANFSARDNKHSISITALKKLVTCSN